MEGRDFGPSQCWRQIDAPDNDIAILSVRPSVHPSRSGILSKRLNIISVIISSPHDSPVILVFMSIKHLREIPMESPRAGTLNTGKVKSRDFRPISCKRYRISL